MQPLESPLWFAPVSDAATDAAEITGRKPVTRLTVMMDARYPLSLRQVEDLLFERGVDICHEPVRLRWNRFGLLFAAEIRKRWDRRAALKFLKRTMKRYDRPGTVVTDRLRSYGTAMKEVGIPEHQDCGRWLNNLFVPSDGCRSLLLIPSGAETLVFWATQRVAWLVGPKDARLMTRRDDLALSYGTTAKARENTVKQDREQATNAVGIVRKGPDFCAGWNL